MMLTLALSSLFSILYVLFSVVRSRIAAYNFHWLVANSYIYLAARVIRSFIAFPIPTSGALQMAISLRSESSA